MKKRLSIIGVACVAVALCFSVQSCMQTTDDESQASVVLTEVDLLAASPEFQAYVDFMERHDLIVAWNYRKLSENDRQRFDASMAEGGNLTEAGRILRYDIEEGLRLVEEFRSKVDFPEGMTAEDIERAVGLYKNMKRTRTRFMDDPSENGDGGNNYEPHIAPYAEDHRRDGANNIINQITQEGSLSSLIMQELNNLLQSTDDTIHLIFTDHRPDPSWANDAGRTVYQENGDVRCYIFQDDTSTAVEELTHAFQSKNSPHDNQMNREMEAKAMVYEYYLETGVAPLGNISDYERIYNYTNGDATANQAVRALRRLGYPDASDFDESTFHINNLNKVR